MKTKEVTRANNKNMPILKPVVSFISEPPKESQRILRHVKMMLTYNKTSGRIFNHWYCIKMTDTEGVYTLTEETIKKVKGETIRNFRNFTLKVEILNLVLERNEKGILVTNLRIL